MAEQVKQSKKEEYRRKFSKYDKNGDGKISTAEIPAVLTDLKRDPTKELVKKYMEIFDKDGSGFLEYAEFEKLMIEYDAQIEQNLKDTFDHIDKDKSGFISLDEMDGLFKDIGVILTPAQLEEEMKKVDLSGDGKISFDEFKKMMSSV